MEFNNIIILVRHGENIIDKTISNNMLPLTELGKKQAQEVFNKLNGKFDIIVSSISMRAMMTAQIIAPNSKIIYDARLLERGWGNSNQDGLESDEEARKRINLFLNEYINNYPDKNILFVTHGALMKLIQDVIENIELNRDNIDNCEIIQYGPSKKKTLIKNKIK
ncbi:MAG: histidine phosphatase family protein [Bacilli bacterium]|nr:histidine phosphatase family protein [Bacilli bacterium]